MKYLVFAALLLAGCYHAVGVANVTKGPGNVLPQPNVHMVAFDTTVDWTPWNTLINNPGGLFGRCEQYGVTGPAHADFAAATPGFVGEVDDFAVIDEVNREIDSGALPKPLGGDIYVVFLQPKATTVLMTSRGYAGYHAFSTTNDGKLYTFAILAGSTDYNVVGSHELYEAATDPWLDGWKDWTSGEEVADICENGPAVTLDGVTVARVWSQKDQSCE